MPGVIGRFAPSPTGPLHAGSLATAMASWLDARAQGGEWIVRIEDVDGPREVAGVADHIVATLHACGFRADGPILRQSERSASYLGALARLESAGWVYPCACTRREIEDLGLTSGSSHGAVYPGTCRHGLPPGRPARAWRMRVPAEETAFVDRAFGAVHERLDRTTGDFVVRRADGLWAYQLAVVVDDGAQGVTDVVRGADLLASTGRQRLLQRALGLPHPRTLHVPLVLDASGGKLGKSSGAPPIDPAKPLPALRDAARHLDLEIGDAETIEAFWVRATEAWAARWLPDGRSPAL